MRGADGQPTVCEHCWISYFTGSGDNNGEGHGRLTAGYGSRQKPDQPNGKIGPEFTFGLAMDAAFDEPVLLIKTAWGGKSLHTDFRPPSAGRTSSTTSNSNGSSARRRTLKPSKRTRYERPASTTG